MDFCAEDVLVRFEADEAYMRPQHDVSANISITDDNINEADQVFILYLKSETAGGNVLLQQRQSSLCRIIDNDRTYDCSYLMKRSLINNVSILALRIGFSNATYTISEYGDYSESVVLLKEDNVQTEQVFFVEVLMSAVTTNLPALQVMSEDGGGDYYVFTASTENPIIMFPSHLLFLPVNITIIDDNVAEGTEAFVLHSRSSDHNGRLSYNFPVNTYADTIVIIEDNDSKFDSNTTSLHCCLVWTV